MVSQRTILLRKGNVKAFEDLYHQHKHKVYFWLLGKMKSEYWAEELLQQTFIKLWTSKERLSLELSLDIQIFRIARSLMIDHLRKLSSERELLAVLSDKGNPDKVQPAYNAKETAETIHKVIESLPQVGREAFRMSREQGLTYREIADILSISPKTVEYHISKALLLLRQSLLLMIVLQIP